MKRKTILLSLFLASASLTSFGQGYLPCDAHSRTNEVLENDPEARKRVEALEAFTKEYTLRSMRDANASSAAVKIVPIVFHIIHTGGAENISKAQIEDAVRVINRDYAKMNADTSEVHANFQSIIGKPMFEFRLARIDPNGNCTDGITRIYSELHKGAEDAQIKGLISWDSENYLNVYCVSNIASGAGAYAYLPGSWPTGSNRDGIVCRVSQLGSIGQSCGSNLCERTLTHEIGHYMNLRHTWGPTNTPGLASNCDVDDLVDDTPNTIGVSGQSCNKNMVSCGVQANVENYMDYASCERMFTLGQVARMTAAINSATSGRSNLWSQSNLIATGTNDGFVAPDCLPKADFARQQEICAGSSTVVFSDASYRGDVVSYQWTFEGATPSTSTDKNPTVQYLQPGRYDVKLKVTNAAGSDSITKENYMTVFETVSTLAPSFSINMEDQLQIDHMIFNKYTNTRPWERATNAGFGSTSSLSVKYYGISDGQENFFYLPTINLQGTTDPVLKFKVAYAQRSAASADELNITVSRNCGITNGNVFTKAGSALATAPIATSSFLPANDAQWREESISLSSYTNEDNALIRFKATNGAPGNNIYIDDLEITVTTGIENLLLNNLNMSVAPNPFSESAALRFYLLSDATVSVKVYDVLGREIGTIASSNLMRAGAHELEINQSNTPVSKSGMYFVKITVNGAEKVEKVMINR